MDNGKNKGKKHISNEESIGAELRKARLKKDMSLESIYFATKINPAFLKSIEEGKLSSLPKPYIRAFLAAYAKIVDLDPKEILKSHSSLKTADSEAKPLEIPSFTMESRKGKLTWIIIIILLFLIIAAISFLGKTNILKREINSNNQSEIPASETNKEDINTSMEFIKQDSVFEASESYNNLTQFVENEDDSLTLTITAIESSWVRVILDSGYIRERFFYPGDSDSWTTSESIRIRVGNGKGIEATINGMPLKNITMNQGVIENYIITRDLLKELQESSPDSLVNQ